MLKASSSYRVAIISFVLLFLCPFAFGGIPLQNSEAKLSTLIQYSYNCDPITINFFSFRWFVFLNINHSYTHDYVKIWKQEFSSLIRWSEMGQQTAQVQEVYYKVSLRKVLLYTRYYKTLGFKGPVLAFMLRAPLLLIWFSWEQGVSC